jgi:hypothetical protein
MGELISDRRNNEPGTASGALEVERRKQDHLRIIFDDVVRVVKPFFQSGSGLNGRPTDYWAAKAIRDAYSNISDHDVRILISASARYYLENSAKKAPD